MIHYKDKITGSVFGYETEDERKKLGGKNLVRMTDKEFEAFANPPKTPDEKADEAKAYLNSTDWYVLRRAETGEDIPADVGAARAAARKTLSKG